MGLLEDPLENTTFRKLKHINEVQKIYCGSHYNYALMKNEKEYKAWGFGSSWVLGNGSEDSLFSARTVSNEKVFRKFPVLLSLGSNHISYVTNK